MPSLTYNIDRIVERVPSYSRESIRDALNEVQTIVYSQDCQQTLRLSSSGLPPFIATTDGVYQYDCPVECRRTAAVITMNYPFNRDRTRPVGPRIEYYFKGLGYYQMAVDTRDSLPGAGGVDTPGQLFFKDNPGSTTDQYYHLYYIKPTELTDEDQPITLPHETHYLLRQMVVAMLTTEEYGQSAFDSQVIERVARKIRNSLNRGLQSSFGQTPVPEELRDFGYGGFRLR
jgi:hypothetical protein